MNLRFLFLLLIIVAAYDLTSVESSQASSLSAELVTGGSEPAETQPEDTMYFPPVHILPSVSEYAYAFTIGGCNPNRPAYKGFIYNILVATRVLREMGSQADVVAFFQLSYEYRDATVLPEEDARALDGLGIRVVYIPPSPHESFYETVLNKFRILDLVEYRRVLLMDGDVMPVSNLDFLFELSDDNKYGEGESTLKPNVVVSGPWEPANAGFFMLQPGEGEYDKINEIIHTRQRKAAAITEGMKFNVTEGWGHVIVPPDKWVSRKAKDTLWNFHFAFSDQGLLYHWTKYVKKEVSIVFHGRVENWSAGENGEVRLEKELKDPFANHSKPLIRTWQACAKFMCDFHHFSGTAKPWLGRNGPPPDLDESQVPKGNGNNVWWYFLRKVNRELDMGIDFKNWKVDLPALGLYASSRDMHKNMEKSA